MKILSIKKLSVYLLMIVAFLIVTLQLNVQEASAVKMRDTSPGDVVRFAGYEWVVIIPNEGYMITTDTLPNDGIFDTSRSYLRFLPNRSSNIAYWLNNTWYNSLPAADRAQILTHTWNVGTRSPRYGWSASDISSAESFERSTQVSAKVGLISISEWLKYSRYYQPETGFLKAGEMFFTINGGSEVFTIQSNDKITTLIGYGDSFDDGYSRIIRPTVYLGPDGIVQGNEPPVISLSSNVNQSISASGTISLSGSASHSQSSTLSATIGGKTKTTTVNGSGFWTLSWAGTELGDGTYTNVVVTATEPGGLSATATYTGTIRVDKTNPSISVTGVTSGGVYGAAQPIFSASDGGSGIQSVSAKLDGANFTSGTTVSAGGTHTLVVTARDKVGNTNTKTITFKVNNAPSISISTANNQKVALGKNFTFAGVTNDADAWDDLSLYYTITRKDTGAVITGHNNVNFKNYSSNQSNTAYSKTFYIDPSKFNDGVYRIRVTVKDGDASKYADLQFTIVPTSFLDSLGSATIDPTATPFVALLANGSRYDLTSGTVFFNRFVDELKNMNATFFGLGRSTNKTQMESVINNGVEGLYIDNTNIDKTLDRVADEIHQRMKDLVPKTEITLLLNESFYFTTNYMDEENDPIYENPIGTKQERFGFSHDPTYFENSMGVDPKHEVMSSLKPNSFSLPGKYTLRYQVRDNPVGTKTLASGFDIYRKWSNLATNAVIYVHRKPNADFDVYVLSGTNNVVYYDNSYDLDSYSQGTRGIQFKKWRYRESDVMNAPWIVGKPTTLPDGNYEIELEVTDFQGVKDIQRHTVQVVTALPNVPPTAGFIHDSPLRLGELVRLTSTATDSNGDPLEIWYQVQRPNGTTLTIPKVTISPFKTDGDGNPVYYEPGHSSNYEASFTLGTNEEDVGQYKITQYVKDNYGTVTYDDYAVSYLTVNGLNISSSVTHTQKWKDIHVSQGRVPNTDQFYSGEKFMLSAKTDNYPIDSVVVEMSGVNKQNKVVTVGKSISSPLDEASPVPLTNDNGNNIDWTGELYREWMSKPETMFKTNSDVDFRFVVTYRKEGGGFITREHTNQIRIIGSVYDIFKYHQSQ